MVMILAVLIAAVSVAPAQDKQDEPPVGSREITSLDFQKKRPLKGVVEGTETTTTGAKNVKNQPKNNGSKNNPPSPPAPATKARQKYALVKRIPPRKPKPFTPPRPTNKKGVKTAGKGQTPANYRTEEVGVTFWRLRPLKNTDGDGVPTLPVINKKTGTRENWTAARVNSKTKFNKGDLVRLTVESPRDGFLYIVNREYYTNGKTSDADLIFPTLRTRGGKNEVSAGVLIEIPAASDTPPYFTINPKRSDYAGEELLIIISPTPIKLPFEIERNAQTITDEQIEKWLAEWENFVDVYDGEGGEGDVYTTAEAEAALAVRSRKLTQEEPVPQTMYRVHARGEKPTLLIPVRMTTQLP